MKKRFYQRTLILAVLVLLWSALVPSVANGQDSIVIPTTKLDGAGGEKFGSSVAIDGSNLGIGAILADGGADNSGAAYVFKITDSNNFSQTKLSGNSTAKTGDHFGNSLDISGDTLVIGAHWMDDGDYLNSGAAYVVKFSYDESQDLWDTEGVELTGDPVENAEFGYAVAISGDVVVVGAHKDSEKGIYSGSVYVFRNNGSTWIREAKLYADDAQAYEYFGSSVAIDGDTLVVGATKGKDGEGDLQTGSVYVFEYNHNDLVWEQKTELFGNDLGDGDKFGYSVAIEDDTIIVGAPRHDDSETDSGAAYVFRRDAGTWIQDPNFTASGLFKKAYFGHSVALSGNTAVVGAYRNDLDVDSNLLVDAGSVYVFNYDGSVWDEKDKLIPSDVKGGEEFGWAVAISGDTVVVGAHKDGNFAGSAYVFTLNQPPVAIVGEDRKVEEGSQVPLMGSESYDPDEDDLEYLWTQIGGEPIVDLVKLNETDRTFTAPPWPGEDLILKFQLVVNDGIEDSEPAVVEIKVLQSTKNVSEISSVLGPKNRPWGIDKDIYTFHGTEGKQVTVTLRAKLGGKNNHGDRATLKLKDNIRGTSFYRIDSGRLPNQICATLPATGEYHVIAAGQPRFFRGKRFLGEYTITLEGASGHLEKGAGSSVVPKKSGSSTKPHKRHPIWSWMLSRFRR